MISTDGKRRRWAGAILLVSVLAAGGTTGAILLSRWRGEPAAEDKPMPPYGSVMAALGVHYATMSADFRGGRARFFSMVYSDSADFAATGFGTLRGRVAIEGEFASLGPEHGVTEFARGSSGHVIIGRTVRDSGRYEIQSHRPMELNAKGAYWTVWRYTEEGLWLILADTLIGDGSTRADLSRRLPRANQ